MKFKKILLIGIDESKLETSYWERINALNDKKVFLPKDSPEIKTNSEMGVRELKKYAPLSEKVSALLTKSAERMRFSARSYHRVIKLARTIADLEGSKDIEESHILEAIQYRPKTTD